MPDRGDEQSIGIVRIDRDLPDVLRVLETDVRPRAAGIGRLVHAVSIADRITQRALATADVHGVGRRWCHRDGADGRDGLRIEDRLPGPAAVDRLPHAAIHRTEIELVRTSTHTSRGRDAAPAKGTEQAPVHALRNRADVERQLRPNEAVRLGIGRRVEDAAERGRRERERGGGAPGIGQKGAARRH